MTTVLVYGGGGFVGSAIMRALAASPDFSPVAGLRRRPPAGAAVDYRICDATDAAAATRAAQGASYAIGAVLGSARTILAATRNLCVAARAAGLRRIVHISSMSVYGPAEGLVAEDAPLGSATGYAAAKIGCEAIIRDFVAAGGEAVILRPGIVYGPGGEQWVGRLGRMLCAGRLGDLGVAGDGFCNLVYHDDLAAAAVAALTADGAAGEAINIGPLVPPPTWNDMFGRLACAIGATPVRRITARRLRAETTLLAPPLQIAKLAGLRLGLRPGRLLPEPIPPSLLALWRQRIVLDSRSANRLLGLARTPPEAALAACTAWFLAHGR